MQPAFRNSIIGDYRYGSAVIDGQRYAIVRNGRVLRIASGGNAVIWREGKPLTDEAIEAIARSVNPLILSSPLNPE